MGFFGLQLEKLKLGSAAPGHFQNKACDLVLFHYLPVCCISITYMEMQQTGNCEEAQW